MHMAKILEKKTPKIEAEIVLTGKKDGVEHPCAGPLERPWAGYLQKQQMSPSGTRLGRLNPELLCSKP